MHTKRIIPCLDVNNGRVVKGVNFVDLKDAGGGEERGGAVRGASEVLYADGPCHDADDDREYPLRHRYLR